MNRPRSEPNTCNVTATPTCSLGMCGCIPPPHLHGSSWRGVIKQRGIYAFIHGRYTLRPFQPPLNHVCESLQYHCSQAHPDVSTDRSGWRSGSILDSYKGGSRVESHSISRHMPGHCLGQATNSSFQILSNSSAPHSTTDSPLLLCDLPEEDAVKSGRCLKGTCYLGLHFQ